MDQFMVDISEIPGVMEGDKVTLLGVDGNDLRCIFTNLCSRMCDAGSHDLVDDIFSCFFGSCNRLFYNRSCQAVDLDIHLNCGDTVMGTCYLEVHIAEEVVYDCSNALPLCSDKGHRIRLSIQSARYYSNR